MNPAVWIIAAAIVAALIIGAVLITQRRRS